MQIMTSISIDRSYLQYSNHCKYFVHVVALKKAKKVKFSIEKERLIISRRIMSKEETNKITTENFKY